MVKSNTIERHRHIRQEIADLLAEKGPDGKSQKYTMSYIYGIVAQKYYLAPRTVRDIWVSQHLENLEKQAE